MRDYLLLGRGVQSFSEWFIKRVECAKMFTDDLKCNSPEAALEDLGAIPRTQSVG